MKILRVLSESGPRYVYESIDGRFCLDWQDGMPRPTDEPAPEGPLLCPVEPKSILGIGLNYRFHAQESNAKIPEYPVVFSKGLNSLIGPETPILRPRALDSDELDYEVELAFFIGKSGKNIPRERAYDHILGYTVANDVSARDWQLKKGGSQWCRGKSFDSFCPVGPRLVTRDEIPDPHVLGLRTRVNGETVQDYHTGDLIFDIPALVEFLSGSTTLEAGTLVLTGTPHGVGMARTPPLWLKPGDRVEVEIDGIGTLSNPVEDEPIE